MTVAKDESEQDDGSLETIPEWVFSQDMEGSLYEQPTDGRTRRRERNREAVIEAMLSLIRDGVYEPSAVAIADRAGVSHRSVFRYFDDLDELARTAVDHEFRKAVQVGKIEGVGEGTLERRIDELVDARLRVFQITAPVGRAARLRAGAIPSIDDGLAAIARILRIQLQQHFAPELKEREPAEAELIVDAVLQLTNFESYDFQRRLMGYGVEHVRRIWSTTLLALFHTC